MGEQQLDRAVVVGGAGQRGPLAGAQLLEQPGALVEVDRAPVVGVDEALLPQLAALVDVGDPRDGQRDQLRGQRVAPAGTGDAARRASPARP